MPRRKRGRAAPQLASVVEVVSKLVHRGLAAVPWRGLAFHGGLDIKGRGVDEVPHPSSIRHDEIFKLKRAASSIG